MKSISAIALFVAATLTSAGSVSAQDHLEKATIPFNFTVGNRTLPAGAYTVRSTSSMQNVLLIEGKQNNVRLMTIAQPNQYNPRSVNELEFHRYGDQYFLSEIRSADSSMNVHFAPTKAEKSVQAQIKEAQRQVNDPVMIALK